MMLSTRRHSVMLFSDTYEAVPRWSLRCTAVKPQAHDHRAYPYGSLYAMTGGTF